MVEQASDRGRVLLIDDSKLIRKTAEKMLDKVFTLVLAVDGVDGWEILAKDGDIQVIFCDLMMPNMDGFQFLEKVRSSDDERIRQLPVIIVTGADNSEPAKEKAFALGATDFITKPFNATNLRARAEAYIGHQRQTKTLLEQVNLDTLTGLLNKEGFEDRLAKDISFITRHQHSLSTLLIELDDYKTLFEHIGRAGYDSILKQIAKVIQRSVRREDTVARTSLARFTVSLPTAKGDGALTLSQRICQQVAAFGIRFKGEKITISLSIGVVNVTSGQHPELPELLKAIRQALATAQSKGKSQVHVQGLEGQVLETRVSIDQLLRELAFNGKLTTEVDMDNLVTSLKPIVALLNQSQKQALIDSVKL